MIVEFTLWELRCADFDLACHQYVNILSSSPSQPEGFCQNMQSNPQQRTWGRPIDLYLGFLEKSERAAFTVDRSKRSIACFADGVASHTFFR